MTSPPGLSSSATTAPARVRFPLGWKLALALSVPMVIMGVALAGIFKVRSDDAVRRSMTTSSRALATVLARTFEPTLTFKQAIDTPYIDETLAAVKAGGAGVTYAIVRATDGAVVGSLGTDPGVAIELRGEQLDSVLEGVDAIHVLRRIGTPAKPLGTLQIGASLASAQQEWHRSLEAALIAIALVAFAGVAVGLALGHYFSQPLQRLSSFASSVTAAGDLTQGIDVSGGDEVGQLASAFRDMLASQRATVMAIRRSADALTAISDELAGVGAALSVGSGTIIARVEEARSAVVRLSSSLSGVAQNVSALQQSAKSGARTILDVAQASRDVLDRVQTMRSSVENTSSAISNTANSIQQTAVNISEVSRVLEETVQSVARIAEATAEVQRNTNETAELAEESAREAREGRDTLSATLEGIRRIGGAADAVSSAIGALVASSSRIGEVLSVIDGVTAKTNLLALNASIIAAQSGLEGRSFSVVADEMKALAERARASTGEIAKLATEVQGRSNEALTAMATGLASTGAGLDLASQAASAFDRIVASAEQASRRMKSIAAATQHQAEDTTRARALVARIAESVHQVSAASNEQATGAHHVRESAAEMSALTGEVHVCASRQAEHSQRVIDAINDITSTVGQVNQAQKAQSTDSGLVTVAAGAIAAVTNDQASSVRRLEAVIAAVQVQIREFQDAVGRFRV